MATNSQSARLYLSKRGILIQHNLQPQIKLADFLVTTVPTNAPEYIQIVQDNYNSPDMVRPTGS